MSDNVLFRVTPVDGDAERIRLIPIGLRPSNADEYREMVAGADMFAFAERDGDALLVDRDAYEDVPDEGFISFRDGIAPFWSSLIDMVRPLLDFYAEHKEEIDEYRRNHVEFSADEGIYEHAVLVGPSGTEYPLSTAYYWADRFDGAHLVDVKERDIPPELEGRLAESELRIMNNEGVVLLGGALRDDGNDTLGDSVCLCVETGPSDE